MDNTKINKQLIMLSVFIVTIVFFVYTRSFSNDKPTCDGYITNVYLYTLLGLLIAAFSVLFIAKRRYAVTSTKSLIFFIISIGTLFALYSINPERAILNHAVWLLFIISIATSLYSVWRYSQYQGTLESTLIIVVLMVVGLTVIAYMQPDLVQLSWGSGLTVALLAGILAWVVPMIFGKSTNMSNYYKGLSAIFVFIFMILILYDTKLLRYKAEICTIPDYPTDSLGLFLDILNLFSNISYLRA